MLIGVFVFYVMYEEISNCNVLQPIKERVNVDSWLMRSFH